MADFDFDRLCSHAATLARRKYAWPALSRAFKRDVTAFEWRVGKVLDGFQLASRTFPSKKRIPGRVAIADQGKDGPKPEVYADFLARGGTLIVEGRNRLQELGITARSRKLTAGTVTVTGPALASIDPTCTLFWADDHAVALTITGADVLLRSKAGPMLSRLAHGGGTVVVFSAQIAGYRRESASKELTTPRALAKQLNIELVDESDPLDDTTKYPDDLFVAQLTMFSVLGGVMDAALT